MLIPNPSVGWRWGPVPVLLPWALGFHGIVPGFGSVKWNFFGVIFNIFGQISLLSVYSIFKGNSCSSWLGSGSPSLQAQPGRSEPALILGSPSGGILPCSSGCPSPNFCIWENPKFPSVLPAGRDTQTSLGAEHSQSLPATLPWAQGHGGDTFTLPAS